MTLQFKNKKILYTRNRIFLSLYVRFSVWHEFLVRKELRHRSNLHILYWSEIEWQVYPNIAIIIQQGTLGERRFVLETCNLAYACVQKSGK